MNRGQWVCKLFQQSPDIGLQDLPLHIVLTADDAEDLDQGLARRHQLPDAAGDVVQRVVQSPLGVQHDRGVGVPGPDDVRVRPETLGEGKLIQHDARYSGGHGSLA